MKTTAALKAFLALSLGAVLAFGEGISVNEDCTNFLYHADFREGAASDRSLILDGLRRFADYYGQGQVREVIFNANCQKVSYGTRTRFDTWWTDCEFQADGNVLYKGVPLASGLASIAQNAKRLHDLGINPYSVWFNRLRETGYSPWISMRMNDMHGGRPEDYLTCNFWSEHPELRSTPGGPSGYDFAQEEVQNFSLELVREYLTLFDVDGIELDWTRFMEMFRLGHELTDAPRITDFIRNVRREADAAAGRLGHPVKVGVRIPSRPDEALELGYDFRAWVKEKLVDMIVPTNFFPSTDYDMPLETWRKLVGPEIILGAGLEVWTGITVPGDMYNNPPEMVFGYAAQYWHRGADRIYLFNHLVGMTGDIEKDAAWMAKILAAAGSKETAYAAHRRHVVTYCVARPNQPRYVTLPAQVLASKAWRLNVGGGTVGRHAMVVLGVLPLEADLEQLSVSVNGMECAEADQLPEWFSLKPQFTVTNEQRTLVVRRIPAEALVDGYNDIRVDNAGAPITVNWVEILID